MCPSLHSGIPEQRAHHQLNEPPVRVLTGGLVQQLRLFGAARLNPQGYFEVYLGGTAGRAKQPLIDMSLKGYVRIAYDFLMSDFRTKEIGGTILTKEVTRHNQQMVRFSYLGMHRISLIRKQGQYASFVLELPFQDGEYSASENHNDSSEMEE